jgi:hypothetical protein
MLALTLGEAKNIALVIVAVLVVLAVGSAWLMKTMMQKVALVVILGLLAVVVWLLRADLQQCADDVRDDVAAGQRGVDTTCSFFGADVQISTTRP